MNNTAGIGFFSPQQIQEVSGVLEYFVGTAGNDDNDGLTSSTPWLSIQTALNRVAQRHHILSGGEVRIRVLTGTHNTTVPFTIGLVWGTGQLTLMGDTGTAADVILNGSANFATSPEIPVNERPGVVTAVRAVGVKFVVKDLTISGTAATTNTGIQAVSGAVMYFSNVTFGSNLNVHIRADNSSLIVCEGNYTISAGAVIHLAAFATSAIHVIGFTVTVSGTPAFSSAFASSNNLGSIRSQGTTWSGAATGKRYDATLNAVINTGGGGANHYPGNVAGTTATGGQYVA